MHEKNIRRQVLVPLTLTFLVLISSFLYASYRIRMQDSADDLSHRYERVQNLFDGLVASREKSMLSVVQFIAEQKRFQNAMIAEDRQLLLEHGSALLDRLYHQQQITHFYFHDVNGHHFLRVYHPENTADTPQRVTMRRAITQAKPAAGLELGANGTFTLRLVYPWHVEGKLAGYIELGQEVDHILHEIKSITDIDFILALDKQFLNRQSWEEGMALLGRQADWDLLPGMVLIDQTVSVPPEVAAELLSGEVIYHEHGAVLHTEGRSYRGRAFPLRDAAGRTVGDFIILNDITQEMASFRVFIAQVILFSLLLSSGLFAFSYRVLGHVDRRLAENRRRLHRELDKQAHTNQKLEIEIAERRHAEKELTRLNENLEQRVYERTSELRAKNREIEAGRTALEEAYKNLQEQQATILQQDKMACIGQLAAGIAHDINNPIGFVKGNIEVLGGFWEKISQFIAIQDQALKKSGPAEAYEKTGSSRRTLQIDYILEELPAVLEECLEGTDRVNKIVLNLKGFSRFDEPEAQLTDIHECLESTISIIWNELRYKATITRDYGQTPKIFCFPQQLNQVFMNLLINASHAIDQWGEIVIKTWADDTDLYIAIKDTGKGIPEENLSKIFEPFFTTKEVGVGTGLGLSIVYDIVQNHGGKISAESVPGSGTVFTIRLPFQNRLEASHA